MILLRHSGLTALDFFENVDDGYGIDSDGPVPAVESSVSVPDVTFQIDAAAFTLLQQTVDPLSSSDDYGIDLYEATLSYLDNI